MKLAAAVMLHPVLKWVDVPAIVLEKSTPLKSFNDFINQHPPVYCSIVDENSGAGDEIRRVWEKILFKPPPNAPPFKDLVFHPPEVKEWLARA